MQERLKRLSRRDFLINSLQAAAGFACVACSPTIYTQEKQPLPQSEEKDLLDKIVIAPGKGIFLSYEISPNSLGQFYINNRLPNHFIGLSDCGIKANLSTAALTNEAPCPLSVKPFIDVLEIDRLREIYNEVPEKKDLFYIANSLGKPPRAIIGLDTNNNEAELFMATAFSCYLRFLAEIENGNSLKQAFHQGDRFFREQLAMNAILAGRKDYEDYFKFAQNIAEKWDSPVIAQPVLNDLFDSYKEVVKILKADGLPFKIIERTEVPLEKPTAQAA